MQRREERLWLQRLKKFGYAEFGQAVREQVPETILTASEGLQSLVESVAEGVKCVNTLADVIIMFEIEEAYDYQ